MKKWSIPAKTFLLGEYSALADKGAILLTTQPCFELTLTENPGLQGIHPDSPAGQCWRLIGNPQYGLHWHDPFNHCGGMGASSAQFLGAYLAASDLIETTPTQANMLELYWQCAWSGQGLRPSGYDVMAQSLSGCVSINRSENHCSVFPWPFDDLAFILIHTNNKLATHHHLQDATLSDNIDLLNSIVLSAKQAFIQSDSKALINAVNAYHDALVSMSRVCPQTLQLIETIRKNPNVLAIKGCGAMGADVLLLLTSKKNAQALQADLQAKQFTLLATTESLLIPQVD